MKLNINRIGIFRPRRNWSPTVKINASIHNRFDIELIDGASGQIKEKAVAENIVLDTIYERLCSLNPFSSRICYGSGTGTPAVTDTTLFIAEGYKTASTVESSYDPETGLVTWKRMIELGLSEANGVNITEVGISYYPTPIYTHAMIEDSEGNQIAITKTDLDILRIYATVYTQLTTANGIVLAGGSKNLLASYFKGETINSYYSRFYLGEADEAINSNSPTVEVLITSSAYWKNDTWTADVDNKKCISPKIRFNYDQGNGSIRCIGLAEYDDIERPFFRVNLPATNIWDSQLFTDITIGSGDDTKKEFIIDTPDIKPGTISVYKNGILQTSGVTVTQERRLYYKYFCELYGYFYGGDFSPVQNKIIITATNTTTYADGPTAYLTVAEVVGDRFTNRIAPELNHKAYGAVWHPSLNQFYVGTEYSPRVKRYIYDGDGSYINDGSATPGFIPYHLATHPQGDVLVVSGSSGVKAYSILESGEIGTEVSFDVSISNASNGVAFSPDGTLLAVARDNSPVITIYQYAEATGFTKLPDIAGLPTADMNDVAFSTDGSLLAAVGDDDSNSLFVYTVAGTTFTLLNNIEQPNTTQNGSALSIIDNKYILMGYSTRYYLALISGNDVKILSEKTLQSTPRSILPINSNKVYINGFDNGASPGYICDIKPRCTVVTFDTPPASGDVITADYEIGHIENDENYVLDLQCEIQFGVPAS